MVAKSSSRRRLDKQVTFALYGAASRMVKAHTPFLAPMNLTFPQFLVLIELFENAPCSVGALGARLGMDTGSITPLLKRMEQAGRISRSRDPQDERKVLVVLTKESELLRDAIEAVPDQVNAACKLTDDHSEMLRRELDALGRTQVS